MLYHTQSLLCCFMVIRPVGEGAVGAKNPRQLTASVSRMNLKANILPQRRSGSDTLDAAPGVGPSLHRTPQLHTCTDQDPCAQHSVRTAHYCRHSTAYMCMRSPVHELYVEVLCQCVHACHCIAGADTVACPGQPTTPSAMTGRGSFSHSSSAQ
eukprot:scaffold9592_cov22-Tisochrysis_lutea.AAC.1